MILCGQRLTTTMATQMAIVAAELSSERAKEANGGSKPIYTSTKQMWANRSARRNEMACSSASSSSCGAQITRSQVHKFARLHVCTRSYV